MARGSIIASVVATCLALRAAPTEASVSLTKITTVTQPVFVTHAGDRRLFLVELAGRIRIFDRAAGQLRPTPFLDISSKVLAGGERGLLSLAFHPDYASNGLFYVYYTGAGGDLNIERYHVSADPDLADPNSAARLLLIAHPQSNHNGGQLRIGPLDGHLYIGTGDGGGAGDATCNAQRTNTLLGKMLRLDVRKNLAQAPFYGIPADNPFAGAGDPGNLIPDEIWALGLRNPWRFSFDRLTGDLFIGDVGQNLFEEIDLRRTGAAAGANLGWKIMEGLHCFDNGACPAGTPACNDPTLVLPIHEYDHSGSRCSVTGGHFYRGSRASELVGRYVFGDYCSGQVNTLRETTPGSWQSAALVQTNGSLASFGEDVEGELYVVSGNDVLELVSDAPVAVPGTRPGGLLTLGLVLLMGLAFARLRRPPA